MSVRPGFVLGFRLRWALFSALGAAITLGVAALILLGGDDDPDGDPSAGTPTSTASATGR